MTARVTTGVILAGGASRRMGQDKAMLPARGHTSLLHHQVALMQQLGLEQLFISRHITLQTPADLQHLVISDINDEYHDGPLAGIFSIAKACPQAEALLVMPVDLPLMDLATLRYLLNIGDADDRAVYFLQEYLPLYLPLSTRIRQYLEDQLTLATADKSIRGLLSYCQALSLQPANSTALTNTNTHEEWLASQQSSANHPVIERE
ncbi:molybdenum cofactor guanylyltransferase [Oceanobacter antarcticus]|uniref:Molybdenum cofactor guanylyltransferase n=1 Tax=Oceanobacter antarcticus TaxID=3133425 RepID=A0ABW8NJL5_9GAMM